MMKKKHIRLLAVVFTVVLVLGSLASCSKKGVREESQGGTPNASTPDPSSGSPQTTLPPSDEVVEIAFWHALSSIHEEALKTLVEEYNQSQDQYVVVPTNQGDYATLQQKIMAATKSKSLPAISQVVATSIPDYAQNGIILSLEELVNGPEGLTAEDFADIYPVFLEGAKYQGQYYSMPFSKSNRIMFYNQDILNQYKLEVPTAWEGVEKAGATLAADDMLGMGLDTDYSREFETMVKQAGLNLIDLPAGKANLSSAESVETLEYLLGLMDKGYVRTAGEDKYFSKAFARGESAFFIASSAGITAVAEVMDPSVNWGTAVVPTYKGNQATQVAGNDIVIHPNTSPQEQAAAWDFIKYTLATENTAKWSILTGYLPVRKSAIETQSYQTLLAENPNYRAALEELPYGYVSPAFLGYNEYNSKLKEGLNNIVVSDLKPQDMLAPIQALVEGELGK